MTIKVITEEENQGVTLNWTPNMSSPITQYTDSNKETVFEDVPSAWIITPATGEDKIVVVTEIIT